MLRFALTIFLSAFLLFQVQPMIGKYILPWFGGTIGVWTTCMLFFQLVLLAGYFYAHMLGKLAWKKQGIVHLVLLAVALCFLPIEPSEIWKPTDGSAPTMRILLLLAATIGVPYMLLSSTGPLLQNWFSATYPGRSPYRLYSLSNVGSLLALVSFPIVVETNLSRSAQVITWSVAFGAFVVCCAWCAWGMIKRPADVELTPMPGNLDLSADKNAASLNVDLSADANPARAARPPSVGVILMWLLLSASGSAMLLATTNQLTAEVAVVPFLWVIPLALYLVTFIICFDNEAWYSRILFGSLALFTIPVAIVLLFQGVHAKLWVQIAGYSGCMFAVCMLCHGELVKSKPHPKHLTLFYLLISAGGALGGLCVAVLAPLLLNNYFEYHIALFLAAAMTMVAWLRSSIVAKPPFRASAWPYIAALVVGLFAAASVMLLTIDPEDVVPADIVNDLPETGVWHTVGLWREYFHMVITDREEFPNALAYCAIPAGVIGLLLLSFMADRLRVGWKERPLFGHATLTLAAMALAAALYSHGSKANEDSIFIARNFYGVLHVEKDDHYTVYHDDGSGSEDLGPRHRLVHGRIMHGFQFLKGEQRRWPTSYYGHATGVGLALEHHPRRENLDPKGRSLNIGSIGLGCGTTAAYARQGDRLRVYEINPAVDTMSGVKGKWFHYLEDASAGGADVKVILGDARVMLEHELKDTGSQQYDILAVDAFSSDAIPVHLLTMECARLYRDHLKEDGILALHISNRFIKLEPVTYALGRELGYTIIHINNSEDRDRGVSSSTWVLLTKNEAFAKNPKVLYDAEPWRQDEFITEANLDKVQGLEDYKAEYEKRPPGPRLKVGDKNPRYVESKPWTDDFANLWDLLDFGG